MPVTTLLMSSMMGSGGGSGGQGIANIAGGLVGGVTGFFQRKKAKKLLKEAGEQPMYNIPQEVLRNQKSAELAAQEGLPSQQYSNAMRNIQRSQTNALTNAMDRRSALMALPKLQQQANDAYANLDAADAAAQRQNQKTLYGVTNTTAQYKDKAFQINQMQPWQRKFDYAQQLLGAGNQNMIGGIEKLIGGAGQVLFPGTTSGGRGARKTSTADSTSPTYYNGYGANSDYSDFQTGF